MPKPKIPFKRFPLPPPPPVVYTPPVDKVEGTDVRNKGYFPGSNFTEQEVAWLKAVEKFQKETGRKFLSHVDYYRLAVRLVDGLRMAVTYRRLAPAAAAPTTAEPPPAPPAKKRKPKERKEQPGLFDSLKD